MRTYCQVTFGEAFAPAQELRREDVHTPLPVCASEMFFEHQAPLSYSADIWSMGYAIWQLLSKKRIFSYCRSDDDEMINSHADVLGPLPASWWVRWEKPVGRSSLMMRPAQEEAGVAFDRPAA